MKRIDLVRHLESHGCEMLREGSRHTLYFNPANEQTSAVPRHREINGKSIAAASVNAAVLSSKLGVYVTTSGRRSNFKMLAAVALSIIFGLIAGLPLLSQKNGLGLLVVFLVAFVSIFAMSVLAKADPHPQMDEQVSRVRGTHGRLFGTLVWSIIGGAAIGVSYGVVGHTLSPIHPLDVSATFFALALIGAIGGFTVGMVLVFGMIFSDRGSQPRK